ncbi:hypothetical protein LOTGIDRAFT_92684, partial [Lottia gigantea]
DLPANSRLFVICGKGAEDSAFREAFSKYGEVEDVWVVKDRRTNEDKGVVYVKMSKTSEAALAMESLNGQKIPNHHGTLKVVVASNKSEGSRNDAREEEKTLRLFVIVPKTYNEADLRKEFEQFGDLEHVNIVTDRNTGNNKGFGYVKYRRPYHAALAFEGCDPSFKPKFADPPRSKNDHDNSFNGGAGGFGGNRDRSNDRYGGGMGMDRSPRGARGRLFLNIMMSPSNNDTRLQIVASPGLSNAYLARLANLVPGLEYCDLNEQTGMAYVRYTSPQCAAYARDKLDGFEYPIGSRLMVRYPEEGTEARGYGSKRYVCGSEPRERVQYCNIPLPLPQPLRTEDSLVEQRLFIVCQPAAVQEQILRDAFCRFGNLIDVYLLAGRNYGYAKYATKEDAMRAIQSLHGQNLAGQRIKVLEAEPPKS